MVAFILAPFVFLWTADNNEFLEKVTDADWEYIGYQERPPPARSRTVPTP